MPSRRPWIAIALNGLIAACGDCGTPPATEPDAAVADAQLADSAVADARVADHTTSDARRPDTTLPDSIATDTLVADSAVADSAVADAGATDTAPPHDGATAPDSTVPDAAAEDSAVTTDATTPDTSSAAPVFTSLLQHAADGTVVQGSVQAVADLMLQGGDLKVVYDGWLLDCTNAWILSETLISCETWFPFAVADDGTHYNVDATPEWWIATFNSNGITDHSQYLVESHTSTRSETVTASLQWLGRPSRDLIYQADESGTAVSGSLDHLIEIARAGAPVTYGPLRTATMLVTGDGSELAVHDPTNVSIDSSYGDYRIQDNSYHYFQWRNTSGFADAARWYVGTPSFISSSSWYNAHTWFVEPGWLEVLQQDVSGQVLHGSLAQLLAAADLGHSIRIELGQDVFYPCAALTIDDARSTVACRALDGWTWTLAGNDVSNDGALQRDYRVATTTSLVQTERYAIASATCTQQSSDPTALRWFADGDTWESLLVTDGAGTPNSGSAAALFAAVQAGADIKVGLVSTGSGTWTGACRALRFDASSDRVACVSWDVELGLDGTATPAYRFIVVNSDGAVRNHRVGFGSTTSLGTDAATPTAVHWFVRR